MSRVFLAEETRLSRQVVIKVLPPEMGAGVSADRFEREIRVAARLQHPHIVPLLTAGATGDLLYYIMPYIAGESLRARLAREGELPVAEAVRVLREVTDALAYAHRNSVVHRDIKPENILMSEGHAVVTDFGVAKAVSASSGDSSLTSLGVALGTPAYMAPEQAAADPHVDHRADLYAVGVLAYEMLCGRTPFLTASPQAMLAAHLTQAPEPVAQHRKSVSPALSLAVMRCLEKHAADRWQSAGELAAQLEAIATPSGDHAPTGAQAAVAPGSRRAQPIQVAVALRGGLRGSSGHRVFPGAAAGPPRLGPVRRGRAAGDRTADHGDGGSARAAAGGSAYHRPPQRHAAGTGSLDQLAARDGRRRARVRGAGRDRDRLHRHAPAGHRPGGHAGRLRCAGGAGAADPGGFREPLARLHPRPVAHRSLPGRSVPVADPAAGGPRSRRGRAPPDGAAGGGDAVAEPRARDRRAPGGKGRRRGTDRPGGPRLCALRQSDRCCRRPHPDGRAGVGRRRGRSAPGHRPPVEETARADR